MRASLLKGRPLLLLLSVSAAVFLLDQVSKALVLRTIPPGADVPLLGGWLRLSVTHNTASAFGLVRSPLLLIAVSALVCVSVLVYAISTRLSGHPRLAAPLGLVLGGSLGNLLDRIRSQGVTDFIDLRVWPVFNVADAAITVGVVFLAILTVRHR